MKIKMLGTGCIYTKYNSATTLINDTILVDAPNGSLKQFLKNENDINKLNTILVTHMHGDHTADIIFFLAYNKHLRNNNMITIVGPTGIKNKLVELEKAYNFTNENDFENYYNVKIIETFNEIVLVNGNKIQAIEVIHGNEKNTQGFVINDTVGYTGDSILCDGVEKIFSLSKVVVADCSHLRSNNYHMGVNNIEYLIKKYWKPIIATHLRDETREYLIANPRKNLYVVDDFTEFNT